MTERHPDDMKSMAEILAEGGWGDWKPREPEANFKIDYEADAAEHWEKQRPKIWELLKNNGVPPKLIADLQADRIDGGDAISAVESFLKADKLILLLTGGPQVGKSLACAYGLRTRTVTRQTQFGNEEWRTWRYWDGDFAWVEAARLPLLMHLRWDADPWDQKLARSIEKAKLLVLDDVGAGLGDASREIASVLSRRWANGLRTMATTNYSLEELRENIDKRVLERIKNVGTVVECSRFGTYRREGLPL